MRDESERLMAIAMGGIEQGLDVDPESATADDIYTDAFDLAFDALHDAGIGDVEAGEIARQAAMRIAQP